MVWLALLLRSSVVSSSSFACVGVGELDVYCYYFLICAPIL